jgi:GT2 family glycosyltransferase
MAIKADVLRRLGGFDPALGPGSLARAAEDLDFFFQMIVSGYKLVYEPSAVVHHFHRREFDSLRRQIYNYGVGLSAFLTKCILERPLRALELLLKAPYGLFFLLSTRSPKNRKKQANYPPELSQLELRGMLHGPLAFLRSRHHLSSQQRRLNEQPRTTLARETSEAPKDANIRSNNS